MRGRGKAEHKVRFERAGKQEDDWGNERETWMLYSVDFAEIFWGAGSEQREAAQKAASQAASFEVLSHKKTRGLSVTDRLLYPVTDPDPVNWPVWEITAVAPISRSMVRITATRAAG